MTFNKQPDPLFEVKESPLKKRPGTLKELFVEAPQYFFAFLIYIDILILYYLVGMTGGLFQWPSLPATGSTHILTLLFRYFV